MDASQLGSHHGLFGTVTHFETHFSGLSHFDITLRFSASMLFRLPAVNHTCQRNACDVTCPRRHLTYALLAAVIFCLFFKASGC